MFTLRRANRVPDQPAAADEPSPEEVAEPVPVQAPQPPSLVAGIGEVVTTFFASMLPPMVDAY